MNNKLKNINNYLRFILLTGLFLITLKCFSLLLNQHITLIQHPYQVEMREGASLQLTKVISEGINPYLIEHQPWYADNFGAMYPIAALPVTKLFGMNLFSMRLTSAIAIFLSMLLIFWALIKRRVGWVYAFAGSVIFYGCVLYYVTPICRADSLGMLLFLSGVIIPVTLRFSNISLFLGGLFAILAFYTKQYGVLGFPVVLSYLFLFVSMRRALVHAGIFLGILFSSIWVVAEIMPCYFYNTTASMAFATSENNYGYSIIQLKLFFFRYLTGISILSILTCAVYLWQKRKSNFIEIRRNQISLNTSNIMKGLFPWQPNPYMALTVVFFLFLLLKLGGNEGTFMTYHFQLLAYSWIILVISWASKLKGLPIIQVSTLGYAVFAITSLITSTGTFKEENKAGWEKAIRLIRQHHHILNDQTLAAEMVYVDKRLYNSGLTEYFFRSTENKGFNRMFPFTQQLINQGNEFKNLVENNIKHQNFDLLMLAQPHWIIHNIPVEKYYSITDSLHLNMYHTSQDWMIYIWKPRKDSLNLEAN